TSTPNVLAVGKSSRRSSSLFPSRVMMNMLTPVILPSGLLKVLTRPRSTGSGPTMKTIGVSDVHRSRRRRLRRPDVEPDLTPRREDDHIDPPPNDIRSRDCGPRQNRSHSGL